MRFCSPGTLLKPDVGLGSIVGGCDAGCCRAGNLYCRLLANGRRSADWDDNNIRVIGLMMDAMGVQFMLMGIIQIVLQKLAPALR